MYSRNKAPLFVIPGSVASPLYRPHFRFRCQGLISLNSGSGRQGLVYWSGFVTVYGGFRGKGF